MTKYVEPSQQEFSSAEDVMLDVLTTSSPNLLTKVGSVIRELVVRPMSYLYSWISSNMEESRQESSMAYLMTSQKTENPVADAVASNYFVSRRQGNNSEGTITLILDAPVLQLPVGASFTVADVPVNTTTRIIASSASRAGLRDGILYTPLIPYGNNQYLVNIPVQASASGYVEVAAGAPAEVNFGGSGIVSASLTSALTGGSDTETDAELMQRAMYNTAESGVGTYYGLKKKLAAAAVNVVDIGVLSGDDRQMYRARYNNVNISPGGFVDCYVKTQSQASVGIISATATVVGPPEYTPALTTEQSSDGAWLCKWEAELSTQNMAGWFGISGIDAYHDEDKIALNDYTVSFGSDSPSEDAAGARLGVHQICSVTVCQLIKSESEPTVPASIELAVSVSYMPGVYGLQKFMDMDMNTYIGQDVHIKAAIPVDVHISCAAHYIGDGEIDNSIDEALRLAISRYVNNTAVGVGSLNFSDIRRAVQSSIPEIELRLPCAMSGSIWTMDGYEDSFFSTSGILDISTQVKQDYWDSSVCYFVTTPEHVRIDYV